MVKSNFYGVILKNQFLQVIHIKKEAVNEKVKMDDNFWICFGYGSWWPGNGAYTPLFLL
jgi:hypothetical protein